MSPEQARALAKKLEAQTGEKYKVIKLGPQMWGVKPR